MKRYDLQEQVLCDWEGLPGLLECVCGWGDHPSIIQTTVRKEGGERVFSPPRASRGDVSQNYGILRPPPPPTAPSAQPGGYNDSMHLQDLLPLAWSLDLSCGEDIALLSFFPRPQENEAVGPD